MATHSGIANSIAFDMGGTTAKACVVQNGTPEMTFEYEVGAGANTASPLLRGGGYALRGPTISIAEVGSGGGSIAWIDEGRAVQVGPESAGARPGPACYDRGGTRPTVTDANVVLGYVDPESIAGGRLRIDRNKAVDAIEAHVANHVGLSVADAAFGIHVIANENMARAVRAVTTERGRDPRDFTLVAFGGSGPVHAAGLARSIGIGTVVVPLAAGLFSALGLLFSDIRSDSVASVMARLDELDDETLQRRFDGLLVQARARAAADGATEATEVRCLADVRYLGQSFELSIEVDGLERAIVERLRAGFESEYIRLYGRLGIGAIEVVSIRAAIVAPVKRVAYRDLAALNLEESVGEHPSSRVLYFGTEYGSADAPILRGRRALPRAGLEGPAIVEEPDTTIVVPPESRASLDVSSNVMIELR
jgi:N-methylhydantoinase A